MFRAPWPPLFPGAGRGLSFFPDQRQEGGQVKLSKTSWPERLYVVDEKGEIVYKGKPGPFGYHPEEVEAWLAARFKS